MSNSLSLDLPADYLTDFRIKSSIGVAMIVLAAITPFSVNNLIQERYFVALGSLTVTATCLYIAISSYRGKYNATAIMLTWTPIVSLFFVVSFVNQGVHVTYWCFPAILSFYFMLPMNKAIASNLVFLIAVYVCSWQSVEISMFTRFVATTIAVGAFSCMFIGVIDKQKKTLIGLSQTDALTGALNRTSLRSRLDDQIASLKHSGKTTTLATVDIDHFKQINDRFGHSTGDEVIVGVSKHLCSNSRETDRLFRIGGEEFLLIFKDLDLEGSMQVANDLRDGVSAQKFIDGHPVTISIGLAEISHEDTAKDWLIRSDKALYAAKQSGRNRVCYI